MISKFNVQFIHSTAKDFLLQESIWTERKHAVALRGFDVNVALFRGSIYQIHTMLMDKFSREDLRNEVVLAMEYARDAEKSTGQSQSVALSMFDDVLKKAKSSHENDYVHWSNFVLHIDAEDSCEYCSNSLLTFAVMNGLTQYVASSISHTTARIKTAGKPLLFYATMAILKHNPKHKPDLKMIECLFQNGADANEEFLMSAPAMKRQPDEHFKVKNKSSYPQQCKTTSWKLMLEYLAYEHDRPNQSIWLRICKVFLSYDADPSIRAMKKLISKWRSLATKESHSYGVMSNRSVHISQTLLAECLEVFQEKRKAKSKS